MKKTAEKFLESLNDKKDGCWELTSDGEGMKMIQVYEKHTYLLSSGGATRLMTFPISHD